MMIPSEVVAAFLVMTGTIIAAVIAAVGVIIARKIGRVHSEVTPNNGDSAHDALMRAIRTERIVAIADHERRLH